MSEDKNLIKNLEIKSYGIGFSNLSDLAARELADDVSYKLKQIVQDGQKFAHHAADVNQSLKIRNIESQ
jgi:transcription initiation factor TFIID subunit 6